MLKKNLVIYQHGCTWWKFVSFKQCEFFFNWKCDKQFKLIKAFCCCYRPIDHDRSFDSNCNGIYVSSQLIKKHINHLKCTCIRTDFFIKKLPSTFILSNPSFSLIRFYTMPLKFTFYFLNGSGSKKWLKWYITVGCVCIYIGHEPSEWA